MHGHADACPRKIFQKSSNFFTFDCQSCKTGTFSYFWHNLTEIFALNVVKLNSFRAKKKILLEGLCSSSTKTLHECMGRFKTIWEFSKRSSNLFSRWLPLPACFWGLGQRWKRKGHNIYWIIYRQIIKKNHIPIYDFRCLLEQLQRKSSQVK